LINSGQHELWQIVSDPGAYSFSQQMPLKIRHVHPLHSCFHTCHGAALNKVYGSLFTPLNKKKVIVTNLANLVLRKSELRDVNL